MNRLSKRSEIRKIESYLLIVWVNWVSNCMVYWYTKYNKLTWIFCRVIMSKSRFHKRIKYQSINHLELGISDPRLDSPSMFEWRHWLAKVLLSSGFGLVFVKWSIKKATKFKQNHLLKFTQQKISIFTVVKVALSK